ncbi:hypothetical protein Vafri_19738, partial [Volvox africanus]
NGDGVLPCSFSFPLISASKGNNNHNSGIVVETYTGQGYLPTAQKRIWWLNLRSCFRPSHPRHTYADIRANNGAAIPNLRTILLLGNAAQLFVGNKADTELYAWLSTDPAALHALLAAFRFAAEGKAFQLRLQFTLHHTKTSALLPQSLLLADYGTQQGDLVIQSCRVQPDAVAGCQNARPVVLIRTASRISGSSPLGGESSAERSLLLRAEARSSSFTYGPEDDTPDGSHVVGHRRDSAGDSAAAATAAVGSGLDCGQSSATPGAIAAAVPITCRIAAATADVTCSVQRPMVLCPAPAPAPAPAEVSKAVVADVAVPEPVAEMPASLPLNPRAAALASPWPGTAMTQDGCSGFGPQLLALNDGPYLVTIVQYPGDEVLYQNKRSREFLGDLVGRPTGRLLLQELVAHRERVARTAESVVRRCTETLALVDALLEDVLR